VAFSNAEAIARLGPHVRLLKANGFGHRRIVSRPAGDAGSGEFLKEAPGCEIVGLPLSCAPKRIGWPPLNRGVNGGSHDNHHLDCRT
jgi:hypothetical protein